jgi:transposase-like protein
MNESKALVVAGPRRRHLRPEERAQVLALWTQGRSTAEEVARQTGVSRSSLSRWKQALRSLGTTDPAVQTSPGLVEVPAPVSGAGVAEVMTRGGAVRLYAAATPAWAAQLIRELNRC